MILKQFNFDGCLSYIVACEKEKAGVIIDPSHETEPFLQFVAANGLRILYVIDTHTHVDHISLAPELADHLGAQTVMYAGVKEQRAIGKTVTDLFGIEKIIAENGEKRIDLLVNDQEKLVTGNIAFTVMFTPGHTRDAISLVTSHHIFSGDTLLIGQCGRTDLPGGSYVDIHTSLFGTIARLPDDLVVYPAHDYKGNINSSLGYERVNNICLKPERPVEEFGTFLKGLFPPLDSDGGKLQCGLTMEPASPSAGNGPDLNPLMRNFCVSMEHYLHEPHETTLLKPDELATDLAAGKRIFLLDVRQPEELSSRGYIRGATNIPVGDVAKRIDEMPKNLDHPIITICESGVRSAHAALYLRAYGYNDVKNLEYGIRGWRTEGFPVTYPGE